MDKHYWRVGLLLVIITATMGCTLIHANQRSTPLSTQAVATSAVEQTSSLTNPTISVTTQLPPAPPKTKDGGDPVIGQVDGGNALHHTSTQPAPSQESGRGQVDMTAWLRYENDAYHFTIAYPPFYTVKQLPATDLMQFTPPPISAIYFQDQHHPLVDIAPPALSIRIFANQNAQTLAAWITEMGLFLPEAGWRLEPYVGKYMTGIKVISSDYMAPGWFVYVAQDDWIFQLTPLGVEAEVMLDTFALAK
ncbi:MAG: hypothetical protein ACOYNY_14830 [Caldilineaceae bacterium]|jgi:hypothetical protein